MTKQTYPFLININIKALVYCIFVGVLPLISSGCSSTGENMALQDVYEDQVVSHKIAIFNASSNVINTIQYRPCGSSDIQYRYLTGNLRPNEKLSINIYSQCVDLIATNAFKKNLVDVKNVDLSKIKTWTIK
ncbi:hypothetical protein [Kaarinaea lacus]